MAKVRLLTWKYRLSRAHARPHERRMPKLVHGEPGLTSATRSAQPKPMTAPKRP